MKHEKGREEKSEAQFRVNSQKFKLNYRIIEENMGKGDGKDDAEHNMLRANHILFWTDF